MNPWKRNYRKRYGVYLGIKIPTDFDVHHIDNNPNNNNFKNLVAIPKELHVRYHDAKFYYECTEQLYGYEKVDFFGINPNAMFSFLRLYGSNEVKQGFLSDIVPSYYRVQFLRKAIFEYKEFQKQGHGERALKWNNTPDIITIHDPELPGVVIVDQVKL